MPRAIPSHPLDKTAARRIWLRAQLPEDEMIAGLAEPAERASPLWPSQMVSLIVTNFSWLIAYGKVEVELVLKQPLVHHSMPSELSKPSMPAMSSRRLLISDLAEAGVIEPASSTRPTLTLRSLTRYSSAS